MKGYMDSFVKSDSIVREIWGKRDSILLIFAGAAAEFAVNKAVDWLYFTGKLPADPLGRLFSTVAYARQIVFSPLAKANAAIETIRSIHTAVEQSRQSTIPIWAYQDVLFMLIHYSIASFELMERKLTYPEKEEVYNVFYRVGNRMGLQELPASYADWIPERSKHLKQNLTKSNFTIDLYKQYKKHLGAIRYWLLRQIQILVVPYEVNMMLGLGKTSMLTPALSVYKTSRKLKMDWFLLSSLLPAKYKMHVKALESSVV